MREQLVRVCATTEWREMLSYCQVTNIQASYLDHVSILITTQNTAQQERRKKKSHVGLKRSGLPIRVVRLLYNKLGQLRWDVVVQW